MTRRRFCAVVVSSLGGLVGGSPTSGQDRGSAAGAKERTPRAAKNPCAARRPAIGGESEYDRAEALTPEQERHLCSDPTAQGSHRARVLCHQAP